MAPVATDVSTDDLAKTCLLNEYYKIENGYLNCATCPRGVATCRLDGTGENIGTGNLEALSC
jgi:hypothetical protein